MLYWICPECGHECSPAIRECPTCTAPPVRQPAPAPAAASDELLSLAQNFQQQISANGHEASPTTTAVAIEEDTVEIPAPEPQPCKNLVPLAKPPFDKNMLRPVRPGHYAAVTSVAKPLPASAGSPALGAPAAPTSAQFGLQPAEAVASFEIEFHAARGSEGCTILKSSEPLPSCRRSVAFMRAQLPGVVSDGMAVGKLAPLAPPAPRSNDERAGSTSAPLAGKIGAPFFVGSSLKLAGESLAELLNALKISGEETDRAGIEAIHRSFAEQPGMGLLSAPAEIVTAPAPAGAQCLRTEKPKLTPVEPESRGRAAAIAGPQTPTLAGPSLPPQLVNLGPQPSRFRPRRRQWSLWPLSVIIITVVILGIVSAMQYLTQDHDTRTASAAAPAQTITRPAATPHLPVVEEHPAARSVEVAGIRIVNGPNKKPQLQFVVINHSANEITGLNIHIAVRSVDSPADAPLLTVSSPVAALGPNQSKEIHAEVNTPIQPSQIPDWQSLRTEVLIGRQ